MGDKKILADDADEKQEKEIYAVKLLIFIAYNELILTQEDTVLFHTIEAAKTKANKYGDARKAWMRLSIQFGSNTGAFKTRLRKKFARCKLDDVTRSPK